MSDFMQGTPLPRQLLLCLACIYFVIVARPRFDIIIYFSPAGFNFVTLSNVSPDHAMLRCYMEVSPCPGFALSAISYYYFFISSLAASLLSTPAKYALHYYYN